MFGELTRIACVCAEKYGSTFSTCRSKSVVLAGTTTILPPTALMNVGYSGKYGARTMNSASGTHIAFIVLISAGAAPQVKNRFCALAPQPNRSLRFFATASRTLMAPVADV